MDYISFHSVLGHYLMLTSGAVSSVFTHQLSRTSRSNSSLTSTYAKTDDRSGHPSRTKLAQLWENFAHLIAILSYVSHPRPQNSKSQHLLCLTVTSKRTACACAGKTSVQQKHRHLSSRKVLNRGPRTYTFLNGSHDAYIKRWRDVCILWNFRNTMAFLFYTTHPI